MVRVAATNITSPIGWTTEENYQALKSGCSALSRYEGWKRMPEPFVASFFSDEQVRELAMDGYTRFESIAIRSIAEALTHTDVDVSSKRTLFVLSTTKGNVDELGVSEETDGMYLTPGATARKIAEHFGITTVPVVVSNACISGVSAQLTAYRLINEGLYDTAIVCGCDCQSAFIVAGFQSFKALSAEECRPFDIERMGLNIGEAASTIILNKVETTDDWCIEDGCSNNDAYHVSAPSPVGDGTSRALKALLGRCDADDLGVISVHGTATMFNDQMESKAIENAGLSATPLSALKGYYGHTMGAAGLLETIITMRALDEGCILPSRGFEEIGVSGKVNISNEERQTEKRSFLKIISGFGGCNGALRVAKGGKDSCPSQDEVKSFDTKHKVSITPSSIMVDGVQIETTETGKAMLTEAYKKYIGGYPKFYKMDMLCKLVFVATELLDKEALMEKSEEGRAIVLFNRTSSIVSDRQHIATICDEAGCFPSPSVFLYTLPNIVTGEIAIKNSMKGETSLYLLEERNDAVMSQIVDATLRQSDAEGVITGWIDCSEENDFEAEIVLKVKQ